MSRGISLASYGLAFVISFSLAGRAADDATRPATDGPTRYEYRQEHDPNGIGKFYLGREIAHVMGGHEAADWLERPERAEEEKPDLLLKTLKLKPGDVVADIGAGTGYFERLLARAVGDSGRVYAEEIEPPLVAYLAERARSEGTPQVVPIYGAPADPRLPGDLDLIFLCNVYRYIDGRRAFFRRLLPNLARSGRVAIVDWRPTDNSPNRLPAQRVVAEMGAAGYRLIQEPTFLPKQYFLVFGRAEEPGPR